VTLQLLQYVIGLLLNNILLKIVTTPLRHQVNVFLSALKFKSEKSSKSYVGKPHTPVSIKGSNLPKNRLFYSTKSYPVCEEATGHGKGSATPRLFPSPRGHPTDVPYLGDFC